MPGVIATIPRVQFSNALGVPLAGGKLITYLAGTTTPEPTYQNQALTIANPPSITLDSTGSCVLWLDPEKAYKFVLKNALGVTQPGWPIDNISGAAPGTFVTGLGGDTGTSLVRGTWFGGIKAQLSSLATSAGASLMGFIQSGVGAVAQAVQEALRERVSVTQFGAKCDGVTDDSGAVALACTRAGKRSLLFPGICHVATETTITAPIADTGAQIFSATSLIKIDNGRPVRACWFGAVPDNTTEASAPIMRALTAAKSAPVLLDTGSYKTTSPITVHGDDLNGRQKLMGAGMSATFINCHGSGSGIASDQGLADYMQLAGFTIENKEPIAGQIGLDLGTMRNGVVKDIYVKNFQVGVALRKNVDAVGNYYNSLENIVADCGAAAVGTIGFQIGNSIAGHTNREGNACDMYACRSYGAQTGLAIIGTGNTIKAHKIVSCTYAIAMLEGFDNRIEAYCESQIVDNMGSAAAGTVGNYIDLFNDALNMTPFVDNGWNMISGNVQAGGAGYPAPFRVLDCALTDHINVQGKVGATIPVFSVKLPERDGAVRAVVTLSGYTFTAGTWSGVQQWSAYKKAAGTPIFNLDNTLGDNRFTVTSAPDGTLTWSIPGDLGPTIFTTVQVTVSLQGTSADTTGLGSKILYKRLV